MENSNINFAKIVSESKTGAVFQGVGDKEMETHFTFVKRKGFHVSTYLNDSLMSNSEKTNQKGKVNQTNF
ncbi:MAG TPA: hypothetical protein VJA20_03030 [Candidatus Nanoarchaeia archaeon]|nr:hypothetical protein [Candidatus Nanoarchaeia archaeon]